MNFITSYCQIKNHSIFYQGKSIFQYADRGLDSFLDQAFLSLLVNYPKFYKMDRLSKCGFLAAEVLLQDQAFLRHYAPQEVAVILSNAHASLDTDLRFFESTKTIASPALFVYTLTNIVTGEICIRHGIKGENAFFVSERFDPFQMTEYVELVVASEKTGGCIAGWIDVLADQHDVFLYLVEKRQNKLALEHTAEQLRKLYS
jgi:hypothetical protein